MAFSELESPDFVLTPSTEASSDDLYKLGLSYSTGLGAPRDLVEAHKWFNLAALRGSDDAKTSRKEISDLMSAAEIAAAQRAAREWLAAAA